MKMETFKKAASAAIALSMLFCVSGCDKDENWQKQIEELQASLEQQVDKIKELEDANKEQANKISVLENRNLELEKENEELTNKLFALGQQEQITTLFNELKTVYEAKEITRQELLNIAYYNGDSDCNNEINENFVAIPKGELSDEISLKIKEDIATFCSEGKEKRAVEDFKISVYLGCYNGYYAFSFIDLTVSYPDVIEEYWEEIDGVYFRFTRSDGKIYMWKEKQ